MHKYEYRAPRLRADFFITLTLDQGSVDGQCTDVSGSGVGAVLEEPSPVGVTGQLHLRSGSQTLKLCVRVAHSGPDRSGFAFVFQSGAERQQVSEFLEAVARSKTWAPR